MTIIVGQQASSMALEKQLEVHILVQRLKGERRLGLAWVFETSKPPPTQ